jgi:hypothetical protein
MRDVGDLHRISAVFTVSGTASNPTAVKFLYKDPSGTTTTLVYGTDAALVNDSAGHYHVDIDCDEAGTWYYRWESTGTGQAAEEGRFVVRAKSVS